MNDAARLGVPVELSDPVGAVEVGEHQDVEKLGAGGRPEGVQAFPKSALELIGTHVSKTLFLYRARTARDRDRTRIDGQPCETTSQVSSYDGPGGRTFPTDC